MILNSKFCFSCNFMLVHRHSASSRQAGGLRAAALRNADGLYLAQNISKFV